jgi:hypothetical protein
MADKPRPKSTTRRELLTKAVFVAPVILTLTAAPAFASAGSSSPDRDRGRHDDRHEDRHDRKPRRHDRDDD